MKAENGVATQSPVTAGVRRALNVEDVNALVEQAIDESATPADLIDLEGSGHIKFDMSKLNQSSQVLYEDLTRDDNKRGLFKLGFTLAALNRTLQVLMEELGQAEFEAQLKLQKTEEGNYVLPIQLSWKPNEDRRHYTFGDVLVRRVPGKATVAGAARKAAAESRKEGGNQTKDWSDDEFAVMAANMAVNNGGGAK